MDDELADLLNDAQSEIILLETKLHKARQLLSVAVAAWKSSEKIQPGSGFCSFRAAWLTKDWHDEAVAIAKELEQTGGNDA